MSIVRKPVVEPSGWWQNVQLIRQTRLSQMNLDQSKEGREPQVQWAVIISPLTVLYGWSIRHAQFWSNPSSAPIKTHQQKNYVQDTFKHTVGLIFFWLKGQVWKILTQIVHLKNLRWLQKTSFSGLFLSELPDIDMIPSALFCCMQTWFF